MNNGVNLKALYSFCDNLPTFHPLNLIKQHYMFLKKSCYNLNIKEFYEILDIIKDNYDINLILNYYSRPRYYNSVIYMDKIFQLEGEIIQLKNDREALKLKCGWFSVFNIYNNLDTLKIVIFGIKITIKISQENVENIAQFIPIRKWRNIFRNKFKIAEQSRAEQSRAEQSSSV